MGVVLFWGLTFLEAARATTHHVSILEGNLVASGLRGLITGHFSRGGDQNPEGALAVAKCSTPRPVLATRC